MQSELPKVLHRLNGKTLILHVLESLRDAGVGRILVVVGYRGDEVISEIGGRAETVWQHQQLGTGHAVMQAEKALEGFSGRVIVACGDVPLIRPATFRSLLGALDRQDVKAVILTMNLENPAGYGRIVKDGNGRFLRIVEEKDATPTERSIMEVNTGTYVFDRDFLFRGLAGIDRNNAQGEYYLTDAVQHVLREGFAVQTVLLDDATEGRGVNSKDELSGLEEYLKR
ncbi:MAG: NTP transferase domain-containing protein [Spirochaetes bacterium]|nr:NTP transferase domain-containing protein [Spirochaetota bacterium]